MSIFETEKNLQIAVDDGKSIEIVSSSMDHDIEQKLRMVLEKILEKYQRPALKDTLFSCIVELATNASRANMKSVYFADKGWDIRESEHYRERIRTFKEEGLRPEWVRHYAEKTKEQGLMVRVVFTHQKEGLRIEVINNLPLLEEDEERIRQKFDYAMKYDDLADFYRDHADNTEGEGLGFALNVIILKGEQIDPSLFRIGMIEGQTVARIEIPFSKGFITTRRL